MPDDKTPSVDKTEVPKTAGKLDFEKSKFLSKLRDYFLTGLVISLPSIATIHIFWILFKQFDSILGDWFARAFGLYIPGLGAITLTLFFLLVGFITRYLLGQRILPWIVSTLAKIPIVKNIYQTIQQIGQSFLIGKKALFKKVVLIEYPRYGTFSLAFVTTDTVDNEIERYVEGKMVAVFLPTTPNPTSGFLLFIPSEEVFPVDIRVDDALKIIISGGTVSPESLEKMRQNNNFNLHNQQK